MHWLHRESVPSSGPWLTFCDKKGPALGYAWLCFNGIWGHLRAYPQEERWSLVLSQLHSSKAREAIGKQRARTDPLRCGTLRLWIIQIHLNPSALHILACSWQCQLVNPSRCKQMNKAVWTVITCWQKFSYEAVQYQPRPSSKTLLALAVIRDNFHFVGHFCFEHFPESGLFSLGYPSSTENITNWFWCDKSSSEKLCKRDDTICKKATIQNCSIPNRQWRRKGTSRTVFLQTTVVWQMSRNPQHKQKHWYYT